MAPLPARPVPVTSIVEVALAPGDEMPDPRADLLLASWTPIGLGRLVGLDPAHDKGRAALLVFLGPLHGRATLAGLRPDDRALDHGSATVATEEPTQCHRPEHPLGAEAD